MPSSSRFQPAPIPKRTRPPERKSSVAISLARVIGWCCGTRQTAVPRRKRVGDGGHGRQGDERIEEAAQVGVDLGAARVDRGPAHRQVGMLRQEEGLEAALLQQRPELLRGDRAVSRLDVDAEVHRRLHY